MHSLSAISHLSRTQSVLYCCQSSRSDKTNSHHELNEQVKASTKTDIEAFIDLNEPSITNSISPSNMHCCRSSRTHITNSLSRSKHLKRLTLMHSTTFLGRQRPHPPLDRSRGLEQYRRHLCISVSSGLQCVAVC